MRMGHDYLDHIAITPPPSHVLMQRLNGWRLNGDRKSEC